MSIAITGSYRDNLTWRKYPNKEENDRFYDEHLAQCRDWGRKRGLMLAGAIYSATSKTGQRKSKHRRMC